MKSKILYAICLSVLICVFLISLLYLTIFQNDINYKLAVKLSIISTLFCFVLIATSKTLPTYGIFSSVFLYFTITHFGASTIFYLYPSSITKQYKIYNYNWLYSGEVIDAILLCIIAQISFAFIGVVYSTVSKMKYPINEKKVILNESTWLPRIGLICVLIVVAFFVSNIMLGNISLNTGYSEFKSWRSESNFISIALFLLATGYIIVISTGNIKQIRNINYLYIFVSIILFLTGNKGEVLYAALAAFGVYYDRFRKISGKIIILFLTLFFIVIPFISSVRNGSIINSFNMMGVNFVNPFLEIGWQLRNVVKVVGWIHSGEVLGYGISYFAPVERIISRLTMGIIPAIPITGVPWSFGERLPGWGFSQVAESYYNFSIIGPIVFFAIQGIFLVNAGMLKNSVYKKAFYSSISVILIISTRNRFSFVPGQIFMAFILVMIGFYFDGKSKYAK